MQNTERESEREGSDKRSTVDEFALIGCIVNAFNWFFLQRMKVERMKEFEI